MKKKFFILIIVFQVFISCVYSDNTTTLLSKIEDNFYGFDYSNENISKRLDRIEEFVYGKTFNDSVNARVKRINNDIAADVYGKEIPPVKDTFLAEEEAVEDSSVNYPIVNEIETKLFNQTFTNKDFHSRIVAIERKLFNKIYDVDDYATRMDRIKAEIMPELANNTARFENEYRDNRLSSFDLSGLNNNLYNMPYGQYNYTRPYANYGEYNYSDNKFPSDYNKSLNDELAQLEYATFGTNFANDDTNTRIKRLNSVSKAKSSSSKYDDNKFSQRMSTVMEIGAMLLMILAMVL